MTTRILYLIESLAPSGVARQLALAAEGLSRADFDVRVVTIQAAPPERSASIAAELAAAGIAVNDCGGRWPVDPRALLQLRRLMSAWQPELIHSWDRTGGIYSHLALSAAAHARHVASRRTWTPAHTLPQLLDTLVVRSAAAVITSSEVLAAEWRKRGVPPEKLRVIASGVRQPPHSSVTRQELLAELKLPRHARLLGCIGQLTVDKRIKDVIWAADLLKVVRDDVHLLIIGDGPHRARLERFRDQVRIADKVHFLGMRGDVARLLAHCDVLLAAGQTDFQSSSILEAMAVGVPVVASDTRGHRELIASDMTGDLATLGDRAALTRLAMRVLDDAAVAGRLAAAAREHALSAFSSEQLTTEHADVYRDVLRAK